MSEVLEANIFFFITALAVVVFTIMCCIALFLVIRILLSVRKIVRHVEEGSDAIAKNAVSIQKTIKEGGFISRIISGVIKGASKKKDD